MRVAPCCVYRTVHRLLAHLRTRFNVLLVTRYRELFLVVVGESSAIVPRRVAGGLPVAPRSASGSVGRPHRLRVGSRSPNGRVGRSVGPTRIFFSPRCARRVGRSEPPTLLMRAETKPIGRSVGGPEPPHVCGMLKSVAQQNAKKRLPIAIFLLYFILIDAAKNGANPRVRKMAPCVAISSNSYDPRRSSSVMGHIYAANASPLPYLGRQLTCFTPRVGAARFRP